MNGHAIAPGFLAHEGRTSSWRAAAAWWGVSRLLLTIVGWASVGSLRHHPRQSWPASLGEFWARWDSGWYMDIAVHGYSCAVQDAPGLRGQANYAFFPLFPILARYLGDAMGGHFFTAGLVLSNVALVVAGALLFELVAAQYDIPTAKRVLAVSFVFPTSFYFSAFLTEGTYLALVVACFWAASRRQWWIAWLAAGACAVSRPPGILLVAPIAYEYLASRGWSLRSMKLDFLGIVIPALAFASHLVFLHRLTGDALAFVHVQSAWQRDSSNPLTTLVLGLRDDTWPALYACGVLALLVSGWKVLNGPERLFAAYSILVPLSTSVMCIPRLCSTIFPIWIILAVKLSTRKAFGACICGLALAQLALFILWVNGFGELC